MSLYDRVVFEDYPNSPWYGGARNPADPAKKPQAKPSKTPEIQPDGNIKPMDNELPGQVSPRTKGRAGGSRHHQRQRKTGPSLGGKYARN